MELVDDASHSALARPLNSQPRGRCSSRLLREQADLEAPIKILLIDDEAVVRDVFDAILSSLGHTVVQARSGREAIATLEADQSVDLVLTDLKMPGLSGWDVVRIVRERWPRLRVGVVSGSTEAIAERRERIDVAITKPASPDELRALVDRLSQP